LIAPLSDIIYTEKKISKLIFQFLHIGSNDKPKMKYSFLKIESEY